MHLLCPKCGSGYRIPKDKIPSKNRVVMCSSCTHMWKQNFVPARRNYAIKNQAAQHDPLPSRAPATRRAYTADVLAVLREEAELETKLRH
jgi:predicted Zn finger-like uncharacterized protein